MTTDTSERGLERLICAALTGAPCEPGAQHSQGGKTSAAMSTALSAAGTEEEDSYRVEKREAMKIQVPDEDAEIEPVPTTGGGHKPEPELDRLSNIIKAFNDQFCNIPWADTEIQTPLLLFPSYEAGTRAIHGPFSFDRRSAPRSGLVSCTSHGHAWFAASFL